MKEKPTKTLSNLCPLCGENNPEAYFEDKTREYLRCDHCGLVFVPKIQHVSIQEEKAVYDLHQNNSEDAGYRRFLARLSIPLLERLKPGQRGLDFGCGPGPTLSVMCKEAGHSMSLFDPCYCNTPEVLNRSYNFITATEVVEHLAAPDYELRRLFGMLKTGGILGMMTKLVKDKEAFSRWHYIHDKTHICFFSRQTFEYIADLHSADLEFIGNDVILMKKKINQQRPRILSKPSRIVKG